MTVYCRRQTPFPQDFRPGAEQIHRIGIFGFDSRLRHSDGSVEDADGDWIEYIASDVALSRIDVGKLFHRLGGQLQTKK